MKEQHTGTDVYLQLNKSRLIAWNESNMDYTVAFRGRLHILYTVGWSDLKKCYTLCVVPNCCWSPIPKFHVFLMPLSLVARPLKNWTVTLKSTPNFFLKPFWSLRQGWMYSLIFLKTKNEVKFKKKLFWPCTDQKQFYPFFERKKMNIKQIFFFKFYFCIFFFDVLGRCLQVKKILIFKVPVIFWKLKLACTRGRNCRLFGIEFLKIYLISRNV